jgi:hypothetical protein
LSQSKNLNGSSVVIMSPFAPGVQPAWARLEPNSCFCKATAAHSINTHCPERTRLTLSAKFRGPPPGLDQAPLGPVLHPLGPAEGALPSRVPQLLRQFQEAPGPLRR